jgi:CheY-like chemotaxis protein
MIRRLLVVEDDPDTRETLVELFEGAGFSVASAGSLATARAQLRGGAFDVVLSDFSLGDASTDENWRATDELVSLARPTPIILLSGFSLRDEDIAAHGVARCLLKPAGFDALHGAIRSLEADRSVAEEA